VLIEIEVEMTPETKDLDPRTYFLDQLEVGDNRLIACVGDALSGAQDGELFLESVISEAVVFEDGRVETSSFATDQGYGLRRVVGSCATFVCGNNLDMEELNRAAATLRAVSPHSGTYEVSSKRTLTRCYPAVSPLGVSLEDRRRLLEAIDAYLRSKDDRVRDVRIEIIGNVQQVLIVRADGLIVPDVRPLVRLNINVLLEENDISEWGRHGFGGRRDYAAFFQPDEWQRAADSALEEADFKLKAEDCPAGKMSIVLGPGWPAVLLHEAIGHGLEGDHIHRNTSAFAGLLGEVIASKEVTVVDDGTIFGRRGSLTVDDEGTPSERTVLVEEGKLVSFMHDRMSARLLGAQPTGNGRRESYHHLPMVRMTNTMMLAGPHDPEEIIRATKYGLCMETFAGGEVDITTGEFVFTSHVARLIENGKLTRPIKGATLIGKGHEALMGIDMVGSDFALDEGIGNCGKNGQVVVVGVGQPTIRIKNITVGGTET